MRKLVEYWQEYWNRPMPGGLSAADKVVFHDILEACFCAGTVAALSELNKDPDILEARHAELHEQARAWIRDIERRAMHAR